ncbi:MAG: glycoside hydrolase family 3 C-terminal domain-containing protein [Clostridia bacterium]|nr:glycoside hydrolase family 3 C-terminal domain-containing protein [Clostridia bacterium]
MKNIKDIISKMTLDEKILMLTGYTPMGTEPIERLGIPEVVVADGPSGVREGYKFTAKRNNTFLPSISSLASTWSKQSAKRYGEVLAGECVQNGVDMLLAPAINIKRHNLCGRNFEYFSEDPILTGELAVEYVKGLEENGIGTCVKHFAVNNQEMHRNYVNVELDMRTLHELYLKAFEIVIKKSNPASVMCAENKVDGIWCSEHKYLLCDVLREKWGYEGFVMSDWSAVKNSARALKAGMDLQMPTIPDILPQLKTALERGEIEEDDIDKAVERILRFAMKDREKDAAYNRDTQHALARELAGEGIVLLKNENDTLPITKEKYKKIAVFGEYAKSPLLGGQGSAEVYTSDEYIESPLEELRRQLGDEVEFVYTEFYKKAEHVDTFIWSRFDEFNKAIDGADLLLFFVGSMESEDTEEHDKYTARLNPNQEFYIRQALASGRRVAVVIQTGTAPILDIWNDRADAVVEMWLGGEGGGGAIADVLTGRVNPSGKLSETFPRKERKDLDYPGDGVRVRYTEGLDVGYRYYDKHPEEIAYPFGHGLSYTSFTYSDLKVETSDDAISVKLKLTNVGEREGSEVVQLYVGYPTTAFTRPIKELKCFGKYSLAAGDSCEVVLEVPLIDIAYYNRSLDEWIVEPGRYDVLIGASSRDIKLREQISVSGNAPYTAGKIENSNFIGVLD